MVVTTVVGELQQHREIIQRVKQALADKNFSLIVIFPTLSLLRSIQQELLEQPDLNGLGGIRLLLFEGFIEELKNRFGLEGHPPSSLEQELLIAEAFQELNDAGKINYLNRVPFNSSYRRAVLDGIREWKRAGLSETIFSEWAEEKGEKEQQLALLYHSYQEKLARRGLVEEDGLLGQIEQLQSRTLRLPDQTDAILYGFTDLTPQQADFLKALEIWFNFEIIVDPTRVVEFQTYIARHFPVKPVGKVEKAKPESALAFLKQSYGIGQPEGQTGFAGDRSVQLIQAAGLLRQATGMAREITILMKENPDYTIDDFLILTPQPREFLRAARPIFQEYGLTLAEPPATAKEFAGVNLFAQLLNTAAEDWQWPEMEHLLRLYYRGELAAGGDLLVVWLAERYGAISGRTNWLELIAEAYFQESVKESRIETGLLLKALGFLERIPMEACLAEYLAIARDWFAGGTAWGEEKLAKDRAILWRQFQNYQMVQQLLETIGEIERILAGTEAMNRAMTLAEFQIFCEDYLFSIEAAPKRIRESQLKVLPPREARGLRTKVLFIAGLEEGTFPRTYIQDWKLNHQARFELRQLGIELENGELYSLQEKMAFYWAIQAAQSRLYLIYQDQNQEGQPRNRSSYLNEVLEWLPFLENGKQVLGLTPELPGSFSHCFSPLEKRERLSACLSRPAREISAGERLQIEALEADPVNVQLIYRVFEWHYRRQAGLKVSLNNDRKAADLVAAKFGPDFNFGVTVIEDYRTCPYRFFLKQLLKVRPLLRPSLLPERLDLGMLYHGILEEFCDNYRGQPFIAERLSDYQEALLRIFEKFYQDWQTRATNELGRLIISLQEEEIRNSLFRWLEAEVQWSEATACRYSPRFLEFSFGLEKGVEDIDLVNSPFIMEEPDSQIKIWGRIDRVDTDSAGNFIVYDYKLGQGPQTKELLELEDLQIPVYLMALEQLCFGQGTAVGGSYLGLRQPSRKNGGIWLQERLGLDWKGKSLVDSEGWEGWLSGVVQEIKTAVQGIRSGCFDLKGEDCPDYCEYRECCRRQERKEAPRYGTSA